jgi:hypothetical protein
MGLRETLSNAAKTAFTATGDIPESVSYYTRGSVIYDASAGTTSVTDTRYLVSMIFVGYSQSEIDNANILNSDVKGLIPQANLSAVPSMHDYVRRIISGTSVEYSVLNIEEDPAAAIWKFQLRKP